MARYLVTAALPYSNNRLHVGHIGGAFLPADIYVRYLRAAGHDVLFICGSDDNGVAIEISALQAGKTPQEICTHFHEKQKRDFAGLRIDFDIFGGTHQPASQALHERFSQDFFRRIHEKGYFTKRRNKQLFDAAAGRFLPDRYVKGTCPLCRDHETYGDQCEKTGQVIDPLALIDPVSVLTKQKPEVRETAHWYLRLSDFEKPLASWLEAKQGRWRPHVLNFALGQIRQGLPERAMTRDIAWGIPVPLDDPDAAGKVLYVWFDAPIGYISFTAQALAARGQPDDAYRQWWCDADTPIVHFIGEDNTIFHALIWPAMLMADARHQLPATVVANSFINFGADKISKSRTAEDSPVWIEEFLKRFDPDALRYYLTAIAPETQRTSFEPADFIARNNNELAAAFGNFVNRVMGFKFLEGRVPSSAARTEADAAHLARGAETLTKVGAHIEGFRFKAALEEAMAYARVCNEYIGLRAPWTARKTNAADSDASLATCLDSINLLAVMFAPFLPGVAARIQAMLGQPAGRPGGPGSRPDAAPGPLGAPTAVLRWAPPAPLPAGQPLGPAQILIPKLEPGCMGE